MVALCGLSIQIGITALRYQCLVTTLSAARLSLRRSGIRHVREAWNLHALRMISVGLQLIDNVVGYAIRQKLRRVLHDASETRGSGIAVIHRRDRGHALGCCRVKAIPWMIRKQFTRHIYACTGVLP